MGHARTAWATEEKEPPLQWDSDPIPAITSCLQQDHTLRYAQLSDMILFLAYKFNVHGRIAYAVQERIAYFRAR